MSGDACAASITAVPGKVYSELRKTAGMVNGTALMKELKISSGAASYLAHKGGEIAKTEHLSVC